MDELELGLPQQFPARRERDRERAGPEVIQQGNVIQQGTPPDPPDEALPPPEDRNSVPIAEGEEPPII
jgi:hypothetical protein